MYNLDGNFGSVYISSDCYLLDTAYKSHDDLKWFLTYLGRSRALMAGGSAEKWYLSLVVAPDPEFPITAMLPSLKLQFQLTEDTLDGH